jgi:hypothetical protein
MKAEDFLDGPAAGGLPSAEKFLDDGVGKPAATDYLKGVASGVGGLVSGVGYLAEAAGADRVGASIRGIGDTTQQYWQSAMTPAGQRAAKAQVFEDDPNSALPRLGDNGGRRSQWAPRSRRRQCWPPLSPAASLPLACAGPPEWPHRAESAARLRRWPLARPRLLADGRRTSPETWQRVLRLRSASVLQKAPSPAHRMRRNGNRISSSGRSRNWTRCPDTLN